jgi:hypothetical protein
MGNMMNYSVSQPYTQKIQNKHDYSKVTFNHVEDNINTLVQHISEGRLITGYYGKETFKNNGRERTSQTFVSTPFVAFDVDDSAITMEEYISTLTLTPSIAYNTFSNGEKGYRYRLIYVINEAITSKEDYQAIYDDIVRKNGMSQLDGHQRSNVQLLWGTNGQTQTIVNNDVTYSINDFDLIYNKVTTTTRQTRNLDNITWSDEEFHEDIKTLSLHDIWAKYASSYELMETTPIEWNEGELYRIVKGTDYNEINHLWKWVMRNGKKVAKSIRVTNGQHRRKCLYSWALIRKQINKDMTTFEHLLFGVLMDLYRHIDNSEKEDMITIEECVNIAWYAWNSEYTVNNRRTYKINKAEAAQRGMTALQAVCKINNEIRTDKRNKRYEEYLKYYDSTLTDKDNIKKLEENGITAPSARTYRNFREAYGLKRITKVAKPFNNNKEKKEESNIKGNCHFLNKQQNTINMKKQYITPTITTLNHEQYMVRLLEAMVNAETKDILSQSIEEINNELATMSNIYDDDKMNVITKGINRWYAMAQANKQYLWNEYTQAV